MREYVLNTKLTKWLDFRSAGSGSLPWRAILVNVVKLNIKKKLQNGWILNKPIASLSTCHLGLCLGWQSCYILLDFEI